MLVPAADTKKREQKVEEITTCPECGSDHIQSDYERGEMVCETCGLVLDDAFIDQGPEWRAFDSEQREKRARVGAPMTYTIHDKGLSTMIGWKTTLIWPSAIACSSSVPSCRRRRLCWSSTGW